MFTWLLYNALCAVPLVIVALIARRLRFVSPTVEHVLWLLVLVRLVLPPMPELQVVPAAASAAAGVVGSHQEGWGNELVAWDERAPSATTGRTRPAGDWRSPSSCCSCS